jgi:hypothetical protein
MKRSNDTLLLTVHGGMEFTWRYAWAGFAMFGMTGRPVPLFEALIVFFLGAVVTRLSRGRGWRILYIFALQAFSLIFAAGTLLHVFYYRSLPFWSRGWITEFFSAPRTPLEWIVLIIFCFWILLFWTGGINLTRKPPRYYTVCARFDLGLVAFLVLYLLEWLLVTRGGIQAPDPLAKYLIFPYFLFSVFSIGLARTRDNQRRDYLAGHRGAGIISTALVSLVLVGTTLFMLFLPVFTAVAETGYAVMKEAAEPLGPIVVAVLRFLFMGRRPATCCGAPSDTGGESQLPLEVADESSWWEEILEVVVMWGSIGLVGAALLVLMAVGLWVLARWLLSRTAPGENRTEEKPFLAFWAGRIRAFLNYLRRWFHARGRRTRLAPRLFARLLSWGKRSGVFRLSSETPGEYGARLTKRFPAFKEEVDFIVELYHGEVYGDREMTETQSSAAGAVRRRLRSPAHWPSRLRSWFSRSEITVDR